MSHVNAPLSASPPLNVIYVGTLPPHPGGSALSGIQLAGVLARNGCRMRAVGPITKETLASADQLAEEYPEIEFHRFEVPHFEIEPDLAHGEEYRAIEGAALRTILPELVGEDRPDVFFLGRETYAWHLPDPHISGSVPCLLRATGGGVSALVLGVAPTGMQERLRKTDLQIVPGRHMVATLEGIGCTNVRFVENAVDLDRFSPSPKREDLLWRLRIDPAHVVVTHISNMKSIKRPLDFVEAARIVHDRIPETTFLLVGDGPLRCDLEDRCRSLDLLESFRFTGWIDYAEIPGFIQTSDIVVMCSEREGLARVYLETLGCERVLVASDIPPAREVVEPGESGLLYAVGDVVALADSVIQAAADPELRRVLGKRGRKNVAAHSIHLAGAAYACALRELADGAHDRRR